MNYLRCSGEISVSAEGFPLCSTGWESVAEDVLLSATPIKQLFELLNVAFTTPPTGDITAVFMAGIGLPLTCYLTAWGLSSLLKFIK